MPRCTIESEVQVSPQKAKGDGMIKNNKHIVYKKRKQTKKDEEKQIKINRL